jgi:peptidoglycan hydrolase CwlO-like protein
VSDSENLVEQLRKSVKKNKIEIAKIAVEINELLAEILKFKNNVEELEQYVRCYRSKAGSSADSSEDARGGGF